MPVYTERVDRSQAMLSYEQIERKYNYLIKIHNEDWQLFNTHTSRPGWVTDVVSDAIILNEYPEALQILKDGKKCEEFIKKEEVTMLLLQANHGV